MSQTADKQQFPQGQQAGLNPHYKQKAQKLNHVCVLQTQVCSEFIGGLALTPDAQSAVMARGDGDLSLMDLRKIGEQVAVTSLGSPLLCCQTDGQAAIAGAQDGQVIAIVYLMAPMRENCAIDYGWAALFTFEAISSAVMKIADDASIDGVACK